MSQHLHRVRASYARCCESSTFFDDFYRIFLDKSPEIRNKFFHTDFERQNQIIKQSIGIMLDFVAGDESARRAVERMGETHGRLTLDIRPDLYGLWLDSLCECIKIHDAQFTRELESEWRRHLQTGIDLMIKMY